MSKTQLCQLLHHSIFSNRDPSLSELNELSQEVAATFFAAQTLKKMIFDYITQHKLKQISDNEMVNKAQIIYEKFSIQNQQYIKLNGTSSQLQGNDQLELLLKKCIDEAQRRINEKSKKKNEKSLKPAKKLGGSIISVQQLEVRSPLSSGTTSCSFYDDNILEEIELVRSRSNSREREVESTANKRPSSSSFVVVKGNNLNKHINSRNSTNLSIFNDDVDFKVDRPYSSSTINVPVSHSDGLLRSELTRYESPSLS
ncbi:hypothetical protein QTN25_008385 [Entamoeba marina]